ncbi:NUDIX domain-containing protein [Lacticaseibacillus baoqingensis]|uniref:NUDIX domain-containing protein n=1 Tax=Lacticaseibacillus baoqingensis TaxID=2486013 RepID=A0ABW4E593_9LACO|nr:NUDIX domain-containing protein [Lacticaseibacillus baoqingensis]
MTVNRLEHPMITITNLIWSFDHAAQQVNLLLVRRADAPYQGFWALPETAMRVQESAHAAALRLVREKIGLALASSHSEQLATFTEPDRAPGERALSLAYMIFLPRRPELHAGPGTTDAKWFALTSENDWQFALTGFGAKFQTLAASEYLVQRDPATTLAYDHNWIVTVACSRIANKLDYQPSILLTLGRDFTLRQARTIFALFRHVTLAQIDNSNFLREHHRLLIATGEETRKHPGRPGKVYRLADLN